MAEDADCRAYSICGDIPLFAKVKKEALKFFRIKIFD
jgi:hypothetical protein